MEVDMKVLSCGSSRLLAAVTLSAGVMGASTAFATRPGEHEWHGERHPAHEWHDVRYHHDHYYPARGVYVDVLPPRAVITVHGGVHFYFSGGVWYRPEGPRFVVVGPPFGVVVPALPPYYTTVYVRGVPYYYANDVYYMPSGPGYMVVDAPPAGAVVEQPPAPPSAPSPAQTASADQVFIYPRQNQSPEQQASDRYACHQWAVSQTGVDPTLNPGGVSPQKHADYQRALGACLDGRGYTVR
jgi:hypothetical protein